MEVDFRRRSQLRTSIDFYYKRQENDSGMTDYITKHPSLKTGYMTLTSSWAVVVEQIFGALIGSIIGLMGMGGVKKLPQHCILFCLIATFITVAINSLHKKGCTVQSYVPGMIAIAIQFFVGSFFTIDMCLGYVFIRLRPSPPPPTKMNRRSTCSRLDMWGRAIPNAVNNT
uniref:Uncharacterized protein n=1 Tax=Oryza punctata TaxID=4537 RepID=A0A0E0L076_ORYPU